MPTIAVALVLIVFGFLASLSIGLPFLLLGLGLLVLHPFRARRRAYWPLLAGLAAFLVGAALVLPMWCTASATVVGGTSETVCTSLVGLTWTGPGVQNPPPSARELALAVGLVAAAVAATTTWLVLTARQRGPTGR